MIDCFHDFCGSSEITFLTNLTNLMLKLVLQVKIICLWVRFPICFLFRELGPIPYFPELTQGCFPLPSSSLLQSCKQLTQNMRTNTPLRSYIYRMVRKVYLLLPALIRTADEAEMWTSPIKSIARISSCIDIFPFFASQSFMKGHA